LLPLLSCTYTIEKERLLIEFPTFRSFIGLDDDIEKLYSTCTQGTVNQRIAMSVHHKKLLKGLLHWVHDQAHVNQFPDTAQVLHVGMFELANKHEAIRKTMPSASTITPTATNPGIFRKDDDFYAWADKIYNILTTAIGCNGVPFAYVI
jgi:hypothetical protein